MKSCEPHLQQKHFWRFADDWYSLMDSAPDVTMKASVATSALVENAAPCAFRHIEQWQCSAVPSGALIS